MLENSMSKSQPLFWVTFTDLTETSSDFKVLSEKLKDRIKFLDKDTLNGKLINLIFMLLKIEKELLIH